MSLDSSLCKLDPINMKLIIGWKKRINCWQPFHSKKYKYRRNKLLCIPCCSKMLSTVCRDSYKLIKGQGSDSKMIWKWRIRSISNLKWRCRRRRRSSDSLSKIMRRRLSRPELNYKEKENILKLKLKNWELWTIHYRRGSTIKRKKSRRNRIPRPKMIANYSKSWNKRTHKSSNF